MTDNEKLLITLQSRIDEARNRCSKVTTIFTKTVSQCMKIIKDLEPVEPEIENGNSTYWYVCGECHTYLPETHKYCHECGRKVKWQ